MESMLKDEVAASGGTACRVLLWHMAELRPLGRPDDLPRPTGTGGALLWQVPAGLAEGVAEAARRAGVETASVLAAGLALLAARLHGTEEVALGATSIVLEPGRNLDDLLRAVDGAVRDAEGGTGAGLHVGCEAPPPGQKRAATWARFLAGGPEGDGIHLRLEPAGEGGGDEAGRGAWPALADMAGAVLRRIAGPEPATVLGEVSGLPDAWVRGIVEDWNGTAAPLPAGETISSLFEKQAGRSPDAPALWCRGESMSYRALDDRAGSLARILVEQGGVKRGDIVAIALDRSFGMVVGLLAILKAGAGYLPFDRALPEERLRSMFAQAGVSVLLTSAAARPKLGGLVRTVFCPEEIDLEAVDPIPTRAGAEAGTEPDAGERVAYINFTSGSTGAPKGVVVPHRGVIRLLLGADYTDLSEGTRTLQLAPSSFDALTFELWAPLLHGGCCVLYDGAFPLLPKIRRIIEEGGVTTVFVTTALFNTIIDEAPEIFASVRHVLTGGEAHSLRHMRRAMEILPGTRLSSVYGPTETTTFASHYPLGGLREDHASVPLGKAIRNTGLYVLDEGGRLRPPGVPGEIHITGPGLALGYLGRPDLTAERFLDAPPFLGGGEKAYRTGDLGWYDCDGNIHFLGRVDSQVKLNGFRIELGEIEHVLTTLPQIARASVFMAEGRNGSFLLAAVVGRAQHEAEVVEALKRKLPSYMVPSKFAFYEELPLTAHGKVDRNRIVAEVA